MGFYLPIYHSVVVHQTFWFGRNSSRDSAEQFGSAESYFNIFYRTKIRSNRISNVQNRIVRMNHGIFTEPFDNTFLFFACASAQRDTQWMKKKFSSKISISIICFNKCQLKNQNEIQEFGPFSKNVKIMPKKHLKVIHSDHWKMIETRRIVQNLFGPHLNLTMLHIAWHCRT